MPESLILDNDVLGATLRAVESIEVKKRWALMTSPGLGDKGHYLGSDHTLAVMQSGISTRVGNRFSPTVWEAS